jgi:mRNA-degrading endonuclease RelE of RelBE toxin-antitoxin system
VATKKSSVKGKGAAPARRRAAPRAQPPVLPDVAGDAPLEELSRDALSVFLYVALLPEETRALVKELGLSVPGFRAEGLSDVERSDVLADEIRASPATRARALDALRKAFGAPPLTLTPLDARAADDLLTVGASDHGLTLAIWRVLADPAADVRARAVPLLDELVKEYYGPLPDAAGRGSAKAAPREEGPDLAARVAALEKELAEARARIESGRKKGEEQRDKLQVWLKDARARAAQAVDEAARAREAMEGAQRSRERAEQELAAARATDAAAEAQRARAAARELEGRVAALEAKLAREEERERELEAALREARARSGAERIAAAPAAAPADADEPEDAPASWLMPVFTREFYDSIEGWDRRIQRAAFKQANLLAQDHRHPSLRALPLEGLPGYYRVRVATDVRLLYRRGDRQNAIEVLSLIDREDLDRYVRQAKTRS